VETGRDGKGRWSAKRKAGVVLELLRGADLESTSRKCGLTAATLTGWRDAFLSGGAEALKIRQEDLVDEQGRRQKRVIAKLVLLGHNRNILCYNCFVRTASPRPSPQEQRFAAYLEGLGLAPRGTGTDSNP
jgi:hypothetical protein